MILTRLTIATLAAATTLAACSDGDSTVSTSGDTVDETVDGTDESTGGDASVIATTSIWADVASNVLCGVSVDAVIPLGADPHTFEPSLRDREALGDADLIVANGSDLEGSLTDMLDIVAAKGVEIVEMTPHIDLITSDDDHDDHDEDADHDHDEDADHDHDEDADHDHDEDTDHDHDEDGHSHGGTDPHVWQDPIRVAGALDAIASAGTAIGLDDCSADYAAELNELDAEITDLLADIPADRRIMVTSHDALAYFADRYDVEIIGTVIPSTNTLAQTNAADLADLADLIEERGVPAIFTEELESTADADALAERLGVDVVPLVTDALTDDTTTYVAMMRSNAEKIAEALTP